MASNNQGNQGGNQGEGSILGGLGTVVTVGDRSVVTICRGLRDDLIARGYPSTRFAIVPNGVDLELFGEPAVIVMRGRNPPEPDGMWAALAALPPQQRAVLVLRYYLDLSEAEIARTLDCRVGTVKSQTARGLVALRAAYARHGGDLQVPDQALAATTQEVVP